MIKIHEYDDTKFDELYSFCKQESLNETRPSVENMWDDDWQNKSNTLLYILKYTDRFIGNLGKFFLLYDGPDLVGCSGVYTSDFSTQIAIAGTRTWITHAHRNKQYVKDFILPAHKRWAIESEQSIVALTFNFYNRNIIKLFERGQNIGSRTPNHLFYLNYNSLDYPVMIKGVPQWVIYENLSEYRFDWAVLKSNT